MAIYNVRVKNRILELLSIENGDSSNIPVLGNNDDIVRFELDDEWKEAYADGKIITARFVWLGKYSDTSVYAYGGSYICYVPFIAGSNYFRLGVFIGEDWDDVYLSSSAAEIPCQLSIRDYADNPHGDVDQGYISEAKEAAQVATAAATRAAESAESASQSAIRAERAAEDAESSGGGGTEVLARLEALETQMGDITYEEIAISGFSASPSTAEMGSTVTRVNLSWNVNKRPEYLALDDVDIDVTATSETVEGTFKSNKTWTLKATDERGTVSTKTATLSFLNGVYYGVSSASAITEEDDEDNMTVIESFLDELTKTLRSSKLTSFSVNAYEGDRIYYLLPTRMGTCSFKVGGFDGGFALVTTAKLTNTSGYTEDYYIYRSDNAGLGQTTVTVS